MSGSWGGGPPRRRNRSPVACVSRHVVSAVSLPRPRVAPAVPVVVTRRDVTSRERRLAAGLRRGDARALEGLHADYGATVFGYLCNTLGDRGAAEDVFQLVMTEVWRRGTQFDGDRGSLLTWVMLITRSRAVDELRRRRPEPDQDAMAQLAEQPAAGEGPDALADRWRVAHLLGGLPAEERELLRLRFYDELSQAEIAELTGIAIGTVKGRMVRALERLRALIEAEDTDLAARLSAPGGSLAELSS